MKRRIHTLQIYWKLKYLKFVTEEGEGEEKKMNRAAVVPM